MKRCGYPLFIDVGKKILLTLIANDDFCVIMIEVHLKRAIIEEHH